MNDPMLGAAIAGMVRDALQPLVSAVVATRPTPPPTRLGVVTGTSPFMVAIGGEATSVHLPRLSSYTPTNGDLVVIQERAKGDLLVTGKAVG